MYVFLLRLIPRYFRDGPAAAQSPRDGRSDVKMGLYTSALAAAGVYVSLRNGLSGALWVIVPVGVLAMALTAGGLGHYAHQSGRSRWWGLLGLLHFPGVLAVVLAITGPEPWTQRRRGGFDVITAPDYKRDIWRMDVVVLFDQPRGEPSIEPINLQLPRGATIDTAVRSLMAAVPSMMRFREADFQINDRPAGGKDELSDGDRLMLIAPQSMQAVQPQQERAKPRDA